jgi:hypothetical protein
MRPAQNPLAPCETVCEPSEVLSLLGWWATKFRSSQMGWYATEWQKVGVVSEREETWRCQLKEEGPQTKKYR